MVRSLMSFSELPISFWGYALEMTIYILNRVPTKSVSLTPFELWNGWKPSLQHLHVWGCPAYMHKMNADKLESRTTLCHFVGYPKETKGFYFYDTKDQIVFVSRNATFLEKVYILNHVRKGQIAFDELSESPIEPNVSKDNSMTPMQPSNTPTLRRSGRNSKPPEFFTYMGEVFTMIADNSDLDLLLMKKQYQILTLNVGLRL